MTVKAIDPWVNVSMGAMANTPFMKKVKEEYFKAGDDFFRDIEADELIERMDAIGVEKSFLSVDPYRPDQRVLDFTTKYPGRFYIAASPRLQKGMKALWAMEDLARDYPVIMARVTPFEMDLPPSDPIYYPLYAKCMEMDLPVGINTGLPGPPVAGECQDPIHLDRVCLHFPQLKNYYAARCRPLVGDGHPLDDQVSQPLYDDLGVLAEVPAGVTAALYEHAGQAQDHVCFGPSGAEHGSLSRGGAGPGSSPGYPREVPVR